MVIKVKFSRQEHAAIKMRPDYCTWLSRKKNISSPWLREVDIQVRTYSCILNIRGWLATMYDNEELSPHKTRQQVQGATRQRIEIIKITVAGVYAYRYAWKYARQQTAVVHLLMQLRLELSESHFFFFIFTFFTAFKRFGRALIMTISKFVSASLPHHQTQIPNLRAEKVRFLHFFTHNV